VRFPRPGGSRRRGRSTLLASSATLSPSTLGGETRPESPKSSPSLTLANTRGSVTHSWRDWRRHFAVDGNPLLFFSTSSSVAARSNVTAQQYGSGPHRLALREALALAFSAQRYESGRVRIRTLHPEQSSARALLCRDETRRDRLIRRPQGGSERRAGPPPHRGPALVAAVF